MFCRICGKKIPDDSIFCSYCGQSVVTEAVEEPAPANHTQVFTFPKDTTYDQASVPVNEWLSKGEVKILGARYTLDAVLLAGTMVPVLTRLELDWEPDPTGKCYQMGVMMDSRTDFGLLKRKNATGLQRQFDRWQKEHPETEVAGKREEALTLGWTSAWVTLFFYR